MKPEWDDRDLDALLRADARQELDDAGFTLTLMQRLPAQARRPALSPHLLPALQALGQGALVAAVAAQAPELGQAWFAGQAGSLETGLGVLALLALLAWWALPQSRSSQLH